MRLSEHGSPLRLKGGPIAEVSNAIQVRRPRVELLDHVLLGELSESSCFHPEELKSLVDLWDVRCTDLVEDVVCEG